MSIKQEVLDQLDALIHEGNRLNDSYAMTGMGSLESKLPEADFRAFATATFAAVDRLVGRNSEYHHSLPPVDTNDPFTLPGYNSTKVPAMLGALIALRQAVDKELLVGLESRLRANIHDDFLQQSKALLDVKYHVAAMVLIGGVLEDHLQKLCTKNKLTWKGDGSISKYNDLLRAGVYDQPTWRRIQSIGDLRNEAAHGNGANVKAPDVEDAYKFVGRFIVDCPA